MLEKPHPPTDMKATTKLLHTLLSNAIMHKAEELYFEKDLEGIFRIRYSKGGELREHISPPSILYYDFILDLLELFDLVERKEKPRTLWQKALRRPPETEIVKVREFNFGDSVSITSSIKGKRARFDLTKNQLESGIQYHIKVNYLD